MELSTDCVSAEILGELMGNTQANGMMLTLFGMRKTLQLKWDLLQEMMVYSSFRLKTLSMLSRLWILVCTDLTLHTLGMRESVHHQTLRPTHSQ